MPSPPRPLRTATLIVGAWLFVSACKSSPPPPPPPGPLALPPELEVRAEHHFGTILGGPRPMRENEPALAGAPEDALALHLRWLALEELPREGFEPLVPHTRLVAAPDADEPVRGATRLATGGGLSRGEEARVLWRGLLEGLAGRSTPAASHTTALPRSLTFTHRLEAVELEVDPDNFLREWPERGPVRKELALALERRPAGAEGGELLVGLGLADLAARSRAELESESLEVPPEGGRPDGEVLQREWIVPDVVPPIDAGPLVIVVPSPFATGEGRGFAVWVEVTTPLTPELPALPGEAAGRRESRAEASGGGSGSGAGEGAERAREVGANGLAGDTTEIAVAELGADEVDRSDDGATEVSEEEARDTLALLDALAAGGANDADGASGSNRTGDASGAEEIRDPSDAGGARDDSLANALGGSEGQATDERAPANSTDRTAGDATDSKARDAASDARQESTSPADEAPGGAVDDPFADESPILSAHAAAVQLALLDAQARSERLVASAKPLSPEAADALASRQAYRALRTGQELDERALRGPLLHLAGATGAPLTSDLALLADEDVLRAWTSALAPLGEGATVDLDQIGWQLERAAWLDLARRSMRGTLPYDLEALVLRHAGEAGRYPSTLEDAVRRAPTSAHFAARILSENRLFLEDSSPSARVRAFDWLSRAGAAPAGFDPLASKQDRKAQLAAADPNGAANSNGGSTQR